MNIVILTEAKIDLSIGAEFYENQSQNLGKYFLDTIYSDIQSLHLYYGIHIKIQNYHRLLSKRFPYSIYYKYDEQKIYIYAVFHNRKDPIIINKRLNIDDF